MAEKRNYWCHQCFIEFIYQNNFDKTEEYKRVCCKFQKDHERLKIISDNAENVRLRAIEKDKR